MYITAANLLTAGLPQDTWLRFDTPVLGKDVTGELNEVRQVTVRGKARIRVELGHYGEYEDYFLPLDHLIAVG